MWIKVVEIENSNYNKINLQAINNPVKFDTWYKARVLKPMSILKWLLRKSKETPKQTQTAYAHREQVHGQAKQDPEQMLKQYKDVTLTGSVENMVSFIDNLLGQNDDFIIRRFKVFSEFHAVVFYFSALTNQTMVNQEIMKPLMYVPDHLQGEKIEISDLKNIISDQALFYSQCKFESHLERIAEAILEGKTVVAIEGMDEAFLIGSRSVEKRAVEQPQTEQVIQGPREGFIEPLSTNLGLLRYRLPTPDFRVNITKIGTKTKSLVAVCYLEGVVNPELVKEVNKRLSAIDIDGILDAGYLEQFIEDNHFSPFPQIMNTERPDKTVANILEGRVAILVDGSPFALIVPVVFSSFYQSIEDYTSRYLQGSFVRMARVVALVFSLVFSALYVAIISFNPELIPTRFAVAVAGGRAGVPFPALVEILFMEVSMEVLREATIRLPEQVGGALSIVGVLVIGQAAVAAGFASPITVVTIALTTIGSFATPAYNAAFALRMLRFPLIFLAGIFGLYGLVIGLILITNHLLSLRSFGVPYMTPAVPGDFQGMKDLVIRAPFWWMKKRPAHLLPLDADRLGQDMGKTIMQVPSDPLDPLQMEIQGGDKFNEQSSSDHKYPGSRNSN
jgi:spore germination protein KA